MTEAIIKFLAEYMVFVMVLVSGGLFLLELIKTEGSKQRITKIAFVGAAFMVAFVIGQALHFVPIETSRPYEQQGKTALVDHSDDSPFPSDHTLLAFSAAFMVLFMTRYKKWGVVMLLLACSVSAGRLMALVHSPLDIAGGIAVAGVGTSLYLIYARKYSLPKDERGTGLEL
ncbi:MAG: phosphatase PAP2 family protein [Candidatus Nomurabacteria bacterium]|jgi:undecaprenyl-diphosphatase|nr:phosphatase PAP2 family protein [Candidatus Nomurabacteria bacterium]